MDRLRRWRSRRPAGGARRAGVTALGVLAVTGALVVLLAVLFHLGRGRGGGVDPRHGAGPVPAWLAVPGVIS